MFFEQYSHEPNIATVRFWITHLGLSAERRAQLEPKQTLGYAALGVMERHLESRQFFVGDRYSIADIALYAYTHVAHEGGFELGRFPAILAWLGRGARSRGGDRCAGLLPGPGAERAAGERPDRARCQRNTDPARGGCCAAEDHAGKGGHQGERGHAAVPGTRWSAGARRRPARSRGHA